MAANEGFADGLTVSRSPSPGTAQGMIKVIPVLEVVVLRSGGAPMCRLEWRPAPHLHSMGEDWEKRQGREREGLQVTRTSAHYDIAGWRVYDEGLFRPGSLDAEEEDGLKAPTGRVNRIEIDR